MRTYRPIAHFLPYMARAQGFAGLRPLFPAKCRFDSWVKRGGWAQCYVSVAVDVSRHELQ